MVDNKTAQVITEEHILSSESVIAESISSANNQTPIALNEVDQWLADLTKSED